MNPTTATTSAICTCNEVDANTGRIAELEAKVAWLMADHAHELRAKDANIDYQIQLHSKVNQRADRLADELAMMKQTLVDCGKDECQGTARFCLKHTDELNGRLNTRIDGLAVLVTELEARLAKVDGPGSPAARMRWTWNQMEMRFTDPSPMASDKTFEQKFFEWLDDLIAKSVCGTCRGDPATYRSGNWPDYQKCPTCGGEGKL